MGHLDGASSPYLREHSSQLVNWFPWGDEAFEAARLRKVPLLISIGFSSCHWCHVMSRETFDNKAAAALINDRLVSIKVDREEYPEVDALYMAQARVFTDQLGWPLNVFATTEGGVFFATTYSPPVPTDERPSFVQVVEAVSKAWNSDSAGLTKYSRRILKALSETKTSIAFDSHSASFPSSEKLASIADALVEEEDQDFGGFAGVAKFPTVPALTFLSDQGRSGNAMSKKFVGRTLEAYARSGLRDPIDGGFFRYCSKYDFSEPHYERMLYDNAGLLSLYSRHGDTVRAGQLVEFMRSVLLVSGGLGSSQNSESSVDGKVSEGGYYRSSLSEREKLPAPLVDSKVLSGWNGLALSALAEAHIAKVPGNPGLLGEQIARELISGHIRNDGSLIRFSVDGKSSDAPATLEDYGGLSLGLVELGVAVGEPDLLLKGFSLLKFVDGKESVLGQDQLMADKNLRLLQNIEESATPSGIALLSRALHLASLLTGDETFESRARELIRPFFDQAVTNPLSSGGVLSATMYLGSRSRQVVVVSNQNSPVADYAIDRRSPTCFVICLTGKQASAFSDAGIALLRGREDGTRPTVYVCDGGICKAPVYSVKALKVELEG